MSHFATLLILIRVPPWIILLVKQINKTHSFILIFFKCAKKKKKKKKFRERQIIGYLFSSQVQATNPPIWNPQRYSLISCFAWLTNKIRLHLPEQKKEDDRRVCKLYPDSLVIVLQREIQVYLSPLIFISLDLNSIHLFSPWKKNQQHWSYELRRHNKTKTKSARILSTTCYNNSTPWKQQKGNNSNSQLPPAFT